jgi:hypothetical protein
MRIGCSPTRSPSAASDAAKLLRGCRQGRPGITKPAGGGLGRDRCLGQGGALALAAGAQSRIAWTVGDATGPWQLVGEQVLIGPVTMPAIVRERIALDPSAAPKSALVVTRWLPDARSPSRC